MDLTRRNVLKLAAAGGALGAGGAAAGKMAGLSINGAAMVPVLTAEGTLAYVRADAIGASARGASDPAVRRGVPGRRWVMVIDLATCEGCGECTKACSKMHAVPQGQEWLPVRTMQDSELAAPYFLPQPCFHCDEPPCTKVCPVDATFKRDDGIVLIDSERCIGCRFCMVACPYSTRHFSWSPPKDPPAVCNGPYSPETSLPRTMGTVEKCDFCPDRAEQGLLPACVSSCPHGVIYYGDENEDAVTNGLGKTVRLSQLLEERAGYRFMEELGTKPRVYYLPPRNRQFKAPCACSGGGEATKSEVKR